MSKLNASPLLVHSHINPTRSTEGMGHSDEREREATRTEENGGVSQTTREVRMGDGYVKVPCNFSEDICMYPLHSTSSFQACKALHAHCLCDLSICVYAVSVMCMKH